MKVSLTVRESGNQNQNNFWIFASLINVHINVHVRTNNFIVIARLLNLSVLS